ncbi:MAG: hypothetical protein JWQ40_110 [Segetibacter sp.]|nr:hypothetical protein [Segetibacter sp.]
MLQNKKYSYSLPGYNDQDFSDLPFEDEQQVATAPLEITGTGKIRVVNTGGSSASEGGMGNDNQGDEKGTISKPGEKGSSKSAGMTTSDETFDPIKKEAIEETKERSGKD